MKIPHICNLCISAGDKFNEDGLCPKCQKAGEKAWNWKGNNVSYKVLHKWIRKYFSRPELCQSCNKKPPFDVANKSGKYLRDLSDWEWLCRKCHMKKDGRTKNK